MRLLLVGYGKMGRLVEQLAPEHGCEIADRIDVGRGDWSTAADVAVGFFTAPGVAWHFRPVVGRGLPGVVGNAGWSGPGAGRSAA